MAYVGLEKVCVDFPVFGAERNLRRHLINMTGAFTKIIDSGNPHSSRVTIPALKSVTFRLRDGDRLGLIGPNGAGKSTLLQTIAGIYEPVGGEITTVGRVTPLFSTALGMDMDETGHRNIEICGMILGMSPKEIEEKTESIEAFTELGEFLSLPVRTYSAGMQLRLAFAIATAIDPEILLIDEGIGAGDAQFQKKAEERVKSLVERTNIVVIASHNMDLIRRYCTKAIMLRAGVIASVGMVDEVTDFYLRSIGLKT